MSKYAPISHDFGFVLHNERAYHHGLAAVAKTPDDYPSHVFSYPVRMHQEFGDTPLHWAYRSKATECIDILLAAGADPEVVRQGLCGHLCGIA